MNRSKKAFSLVEMMVVVLLTGMMGGAAILFLLEGTRASLRAVSAIDNDIVQWNMSNRLTIDSKLANSAVVYEDLVAERVKPELRRNANQRGNLLVLALSTSPNGSMKSEYTRLTGYLYNPTYRTLNMFTYIPTASERAAKLDLERIITDNIANFTFKTVAKDVVALDSSGPFVNRDVSTRNVNSAAATFRLDKGSSTLLTKNSVLVEIAFLVRG